MTKTFAALAVALMIATPALAEGVGENGNNGLPEQAVAVGQLDYQLNASGHWAKHEVAAPRQTASLSADQQVSVAQIGVPSAEAPGLGTN